MGFQIYLAWKHSQRNGNLSEERHIELCAWSASTFTRHIPYCSLISLMQKKIFVKAVRNKQRMQVQLNLYLRSEKLFFQYYPADLFFTLKGQIMRIMSHFCSAVQRINAFKAATMFFFFKLQNTSSCPLLLSFFGYQNNAWICCEELRLDYKCLYAVENVAAQGKCPQV